MIRTLLLFALASLCNFSYAQKFPDSLSATTSFIRFNPLGLVDLNDMNISLGVEKRITKRSSFAFDAGFIFYSLWMRDQTRRNTGFILRPSYRFFPGKSYLFLEAELHYKQVTHELTDWVGRAAINDVPSYEEFMNFRLKKTAIGSHIKIGRQYNVSDRLWLEIYLGLGVHYRKYKVADDPRMRYIVNDLFFEVNTNDADLLPAVPAGLRLLYRLSR
ncbi:MAG: DUF3575 domain-containing protein [Chitinophagaceae bacterium]|nr:DUF3575 domain-containing protein [Chitinophagaceae bacterium]